MFQIYKNKEFDKWARKHGISDKQLYGAAMEVNAESYEANLGGNVYKKRISINNQGKRGGARSIVAFKSNEKLFFVYGFKKSKKANISSKEELSLKELADVLLNLTGQQLNKLLEDRKLFLVEA